MSLPSGFGGGTYGGPKGDKGLALPFLETLRLSFQDPDLKQRILFVMFMFGVFTLGAHIQVPIPGLSSRAVMDMLENNPALGLLDVFGGGALRRISIFSLGLNPYITASIIIQILTTANPKLKQELQEGGEYARRQQNKRTRALTLALCLFQGWGILQLMASGAPAIAALPLFLKIVILAFWTAGAMFVLWLGEQISEKGIGNGVSLMIFAGIILSLPGQGAALWRGVQDGVVNPISVLIVILVFVAATWFIVLFTTAQRRIPIQHMRRVVGTRAVGGQTSYLPLSVNMAGVLPIIFAVSLVYLPNQLASMVPNRDVQAGIQRFAEWFQPSSTIWYKAIVGAIVYTALIFFFTYFWTAIQYNVEDISNNLKRGGSFIPGVRPGKQTKDFLDGVISRITMVGAAFIAVVALLQYITPRLAGIPPGTYISVIGGTSLLIMVQVALETMRQIEANILMKQYGQ
ncbi:MAG TPA: preprotein translocase subunit SecY [Fimbriimonas sp.]